MIQLYRYRLPFHRLFRNADDAWHHREGAILRFREEALDLAAEIAPLPGFSEETLPDVLRILEERRDELERFASSLDSLGELRKMIDGVIPPSLRFALSSLGFQLLAHRRPRELDPILQSPPVRRLAVNCVAGIDNRQELIQAIDTSYRTGYRTVKIKCGADPTPLFDLLETIRTRYPGLHVRIDANRSWAPDQSLRILRECAGYPVEYCEEPCRFETPEEASELREQSPVPLALDESLRTPEQLDRWMRAEAADVVILKPTLLGDLPRLFEILNAHRDRGIRTVITTTLESGVGRQAVNRFASLAGSAELAHGLDTGRLMREDLIRRAVAPVLEVPANMPWCPAFGECIPSLLTPLEAQP